MPRRGGLKYILGINDAEKTEEEIKRDLQSKERELQRTKTFLQNLPRAFLQVFDESVKSSIQSFVLDSLSISDDLKSRSGATCITNAGMLKDYSSSDDSCAAKLYMETSTGTEREKKDEGMIMKIEATLDEIYFHCLEEYTFMPLCLDALSGHLCSIEFQNAQYIFQFKKSTFQQWTVCLFKDWWIMVVFTIFDRVSFSNQEMRGSIKRMYYTLEESTRAGVKFQEGVIANTNIQEWACLKKPVISAIISNQERKRNLALASSQHKRSHDTSAMGRLLNPDLLRKIVSDNGTLPSHSDDIYSTEEVQNILKSMGNEDFERKQQQTQSALCLCLQCGAIIKNAVSDAF
jgi:hypothetical protein